MKIVISVSLVAESEVAPTPIELISATDRQLAELNGTAERGKRPAEPLPVSRVTGDRTPR